LKTRNIFRSLSKMISSFLLQIFQSLSPTEQIAARKFLLSPYFNSRSDVLSLFDLLVQAQRQATLEQLTKEQVFRQLFPGQPYHNLNLNHLFAYLTERLEHYLALVEMQRDGLAEQLYRIRAFRRRGLQQLFERDAARLEQAHAASPHRHAGWFLFHYQLQNEIFSQRIIQRRAGETNLQATVDALGQFFLLENLRWACTAQSLRSLGGQTHYHLPLIDAVREAATLAGSDQPALSLLGYSLQALQNPDDVTAFRQATALLTQHPDLFPAAESRDLYMAAINFCIRRQNRGEREYAREALALYRDALVRGILLENGVLPKYTYNNIHLLAQVTGERDWALTFLEQYRDYLPPAERDNIFRYNLAIFHYRAGEHERVLELLREVEFSEVFINLDVRRMLLKGYYELGEWSVLASLLDSFKAYLRRQKDLGYHRASYLNLVKFTQKVMRVAGKRAAVRQQVIAQIQATEAVAEREWLLEKLES